MIGWVLERYLVSETGCYDGNISHATKQYDGEIEDDESDVSEINNPRNKLLLFTFIIPASNSKNSNFL